MGKDCEASRRGTTRLHTVQLLVLVAKRIGVPVCSVLAPSGVPGIRSCVEEVDDVGREQSRNPPLG